MVEAHAEVKQRTDLTPFAFGSQLSNFTLIFFNCASDGGNLQAAAPQTATTATEAAQYRRRQFRRRQSAARPLE
jgi:hypothetical protein